MRAKAGFNWGTVVGIGIAFGSFMLISEIFDQKIGFLLAVVVASVMILKTGTGSALADFLSSTANRVITL